MGRRRPARRPSASTSSRNSSGPHTATCSRSARWWRAGSTACSQSARRDRTPAEAAWPSRRSAPDSGRMTELARLEKKLLQRMKRTCEDHRLLEPGDRILVGVSGGKDSYTLLHLLDQLTPRLPFEVSVIAVHLDQAQPGYDGTPLRDHLEARGKAYEILRGDTYSVVVDHVEEGGTYCSLCSRLRRGILYTAAERLGCNKIALGHHRDDTLETFLLNLCYSGKLQAMPARYVTDDGRFEVIRPL